MRMCCSTMPIHRRGERALFSSLVPATMKHASPALIRIEDGARSDTFVNWSMGVVALVGAAALPWLFGEPLTYDIDSPDFNPAVFLVALLAVTGTVYLGRGLYETIRGRRFGISVLEFPPPGPKMGKPFAGTIRCPPNLRPTAEYRVRICLVETFRVRDRDRGEPIYRNIDHVRWEATQAIAAETAQSGDGIPFEFSLPVAESLERAMDSASIIQKRMLVEYGLPGTEQISAYNRRPDAVRWILDIRAPFDGVDYYATFGIRAESTVTEGATEGTRKRRR